MVWVWQGSRVNSRLAGCLAGELAGVVLLPGGGNWKLMLVWCCCLVVEADADLVQIVVAWIYGGCLGAIGVC